MEAGFQSKQLATICLLTISVMACGASCPRRVAPTGPASPTVFFGTPTIDQIIQVVNTNTQRVRQLQTSGGKLTVQGAPSLQATLALERPLRFRLRGETVITGPEIDIGSNDELFWLWAKRNDQPEVYFARHAEFIPGANGVLPLPPTWLIEALGLVELDPQAVYEGPFTSGPGQVEIRYVTSNPTALTKTLVIDAQRGHILEQRVYDVSGQLLAAARMSDYRFNPVQAVALPHAVQIQLPPAQIAFTFETQSFSVNQLYADPASLWTIPQIAGSAYRDLAH